MGEAKRRKGQDPSFGKPRIMSSHQTNLDIETLIPISLPVHQIPNEDWVESLQCLQKPWIKDPKNATSTYQLVKEVFWQVVLELVIKEKWLRNRQIPSGRAFQTLAKPKAQVLYRILELTIQCHSFAAKEYGGNPPISASCWFGFIFMDFKAADLASVYDGRINVEQERRWQRQNILKPLGKTRNPYPVDEHLGHLINVAERLAVASPQFEDDFWNPFVKAQKADVNLSGLDANDLTPVWIEKNGLYTSLRGGGKGSGKGKQLLWQF